MQHDDGDVGEATVETVCPACAARARARAHPRLKGTTVTSIVVNGADGERWTVMVRRGHAVIASAHGATEEDAMAAAYEPLGVVLE